MPRKPKAPIETAADARTMYRWVCSQIKRKLANEKLSYYQIVKLTGITPSVLTRFKRGEGTLSAENLLTIMALLNINLTPEFHRHAQQIRKSRKGGKSARKAKKK